jgi:UDP-N-acetylmuramoyl-tripeptide--D-alanyl-D-alanine ligase
MRAAIKTLSNFSGNKIAVLGPMAELGNDSEKYHQEIGDYAKENIDQIYSYGEQAKAYNVKHFDNLNDLYKTLTEQGKNSTILVKGSRFIKLDQLIEMFIK